MKVFLSAVLPLLFSTHLFAQSTPFLRVQPGDIDGFDRYPAVSKRIQDSFPVIETIVNSEEFKDRVINFVNKKGKREFVSNKGYSNEQIYNLLMEAKEVLNGENTPHEMNLNLKRYIPANPWSKVIAYTLPGKSTYISLNGRKYGSITVNGIASNLTHEWTHLMGFTHGSAASHDSVPYAVGYIVSDLAKKLSKQGYLD